MATSISPCITLFLHPFINTMGLSNGESNIIYLNIKSVDDVPKFQKYNWKDESWESQYEYYSEFTGNFQSIEFADKDITYKGKTSTKREIKIKFVDGWQEYIINSLMWWVMRSLLNLLNSVDELGVVTIKLYKNAKWYASVYAENNGTKLEWALSWDEQQEFIESVEVNWDKINNYTALNEALEATSKNLKAQDIAQTQSDAVVKELWLEDDDTLAKALDEDSPF